MNRRSILKYVLPPAILGAGVVLTGGMIAATGSAATAPPTESVTPVEVVAAQQDAQPAEIVATGTVSAAQQVVVTPELGGKLTWVSDQLVPGGRFAAGELMARIDSRNMVAALEAAELSLAQAELELALEESRGQVAQKEWAMLASDDRSGRDPELALRKPHLAVARQSVVSAKAAVDKARADLGRTRLTAPFNAAVVSENVDLGQVVGASSQVATLVGIDRARVTVSLPVERVAVLDVPGLARADGTLPTTGSRALVRQELADGSTLEREGRVIALSGTLDPQTRTAQVIVEVDQSEARGVPLMPGAFVTVQLRGRALERAFRVPRIAVKDGDTVWTVDSDDRLAPVEVRVGWSLPEEVVITSGLEEGQKIVVSALSNPLAGQRVSARDAAEL